MYHNGVMTSGTHIEDWGLSEMQYLKLVVCVHDIQD